jgi:hypothetical protein
MTEEKMIARIALAALIAASAAGSALALIPDSEFTAIEAYANETIVTKSQSWHLIDTLTVEECLTETCEDTAS